MNLKQLRKKHGVTQHQLAGKLKVNTSTCSLIENGVVLPSLEQMVLLSRLFNSTISWGDISPQDKTSILASMEELSKVYPLFAVIEFAAKTFRKSSDPAKFIGQFAKSALSKHEPLHQQYEYNLNAKTSIS